MWAAQLGYNAAAFHAGLSVSTKERVQRDFLNDDITIRLQVKSRNHNFLTSIDGRSQNLDDHVELMIRRAPYRIHLVKRSNSHFFDTLRNKLLWGADKRI